MILRICRNRRGRADIIRLLNDHIGHRVSRRDGRSCFTDAIIKKDIRTTLGRPRKGCARNRQHGLTAFHRGKHTNRNLIGRHVCTAVRKGTILNRNRLRTCGLVIKVYCLVQVGEINFAERDCAIRIGVNSFFDNALKRGILNCDIKRAGRPRNKDFAHIPATVKNEIYSVRGGLGAPSTAPIQIFHRKGHISGNILTATRIGITNIKIAFSTAGNRSAIAINRECSRYWRMLQSAHIGPGFAVEHCSRRAANGFNSSLKRCIISCAIRHSIRAKTCAGHPRGKDNVTLFHRIFRECLRRDFNKLIPICFLNVINPQKLILVRHLGKAAPS